MTRMTVTTSGPDAARDPAYDPAGRHSASGADQSDIRARVQQLTMRQQRFERSIARRLDVDTAGLEVLDHLIAVGPATPTELARRVEVSTAAMTLVLNRLEDRGHVRRERHPSDGRKLIVTANETAAGEAERMVAPLIREVEELIAAMGEAERSAVSGFLDRLIRAYDRSIPAAP